LCGDFVVVCGGDDDVGVHGGVCIDVLVCG
jgi:hypothetical protein